jgi:hypothetical protein
MAEVQTQDHQEVSSGIMAQGWADTGDPLAVVDTTTGTRSGRGISPANTMSYVGPYSFRYFYSSRTLRPVLFFPFLVAIDWVIWIMPLGTFELGRDEMRHTSQSCINAL